MNICQVILGVAISLYQRIFQNMKNACLKFVQKMDKVWLVWLLLFYVKGVGVFHVLIFYAIKFCFNCCFHFQFFSLVFPSTLLLTLIFSRLSPKYTASVERWFYWSTIFYGGGCLFSSFLSSEMSTSSYPISFNYSCCFSNSWSYFLDISSDLANIYFSEFSRSDFDTNYEGGVGIVVASLYMVMFPLETYCVFLEGDIISNVDFWGL